MDLPESLSQVFLDIVPHTRVFWIPGNHDADRDEWYDRAYDSELSANNLHGRVVEIAGIRIAGLGGIFRANIWHPDVGVRYEKREFFLASMGKGNRWRGGIPRKHHVSIWPEDYQALKKKRADILVTHEAPSCHRHGFKDIDLLADDMGVRTIFHGHHHETYHDSVVSGKIVVHGVGIRGVKDIDGNVILPGDYDDNNKYSNDK